MKNIEFRIQQNTDNVDIDQKCLGLSVWVPGDGLNLLNTNRGLHTQIRHNGDSYTFEAANKLSKLIRHSPEMLEQLKLIQEYLKAKGTQWTGIDTLINKIEK